MFETVLRLVVISILVSLFASGIKLIPRYPKWKYVFIQQLTNAVLQTIFMTLLFTFDLSSSWWVLFAVILLILWASVRFTNELVRRNESAAEAMARSDANDQGGRLS